MKVKRIGALCKASKRCYLWNELTEAGEIRRQWISNGEGLWPVSGLPMLSESNLSTLFDFSPNQLKEMIVKEEALPEKLYGILYDFAEGEEALQESFIRLRKDGTEYMALTAGSRVIWLATELLRPCWGNQPRLVRREIEESDAIAVLDGLMLAGIIMPAIMGVDLYRELLRLGVSAPRPVTQPEEPPEDEDTDEDGGDEL